ncbi:MAG: hypothetical protein IJJ44_03810, partial [Solobacterium sp.]|nr:hypothetical protein [Solobacterium sp.]
YTAETITGEEETVLTEENEEENIIVLEQEEEPEETEVPEVEEEPEETETPEVSEPEETEVPEVTEPEETEEPEITEEPEETEVPEVTEPEETEEPEEEPEETEEPAPAEEEPWEEPEELLELDDSEPFQMQITPEGMSGDMTINDAQYDSYLDDGSFTISYTKSIPFRSYIVAIKDDVVWFLDRDDSSSTGSYTSDIFCNIPAGEYELRLAWFLFGDLYVSTDYYTLVVLPAPKVVGTGNFHGYEDGKYAYIDLDAYAILGGNYDINAGLDYDYILLSISNDEPIYDANTLKFLKYNQHDGVFRIELGNPNSYGGQGYYENYPYGNFDLRFVARGSGTVKNGYIFASSTTTHVDITQELTPVVMWVNDDLPYGGMYYKGQTAHMVYGFDYQYNKNDMDRRVTFQSNNTKYVKVDANGTLTCVGLPPADKSPVRVKITVTSVADPSVQEIHYVYVFSMPTGPAEMKVLADGKELSTYNWSIGKQIDHSHMEEVVFRMGEEFATMDVVFNVTGKGLKLYKDPSTPFDYPYEGSLQIGSDGTAHFYVMCGEGGTYKINATTPIGKTASVTINVDGFDNSPGAGNPSKDSHYYVNGKITKGWVRYDSNTDTNVFGKDVFKGDIWPSHQGIYYCDPSTGKVTTGDIYSGSSTVRKIDKKLYAFDCQGELMLHSSYDGKADEGWTDSYIYLDQLDENYKAYVSRTGEILTGWQLTAEGWYYFNPDFGYKVGKSFVPARNGKGMTYVDYNGYETYGILVAPGKPTQRITDGDGLYRIVELGKYYWVKDGAFYTGWMYLHEDKNHNLYWDTNSKNVLEKMYFDPNDYGAMELGTFMVGGKMYYSDITMYSAFYADEYDYYYTVKTIKGLYYGRNYPEKYMKYNGRIVDANGAIVENKLVKIAIEMTGVYYTKYVYADGSGYPVTDTWMTVNGKRYYFDSSGWLDTLAMSPTEWYYVDEYDNDQNVFYTLKNPKKPEEGYVYCTFGGQKLTSLLLHDSYGNKNCMVDAKGNLVVSGMATVRSSFTNGAVTSTYIADQNGEVVKSASSSEAQIITVKGKKYIVDLYGRVLKNSTEPVPAVTEDGGTNVIVMADKNGVLVKKTFKTLSDGTHGTYKVWFDEKGYIAQYTEGWLYHDGNADYYAINLNKKPYLCFTGPDYLMFVVPGKTNRPGWSEVFTTGWFGNSDSPIYINKDGSIKTGFVKRGGDTRYIHVSSVGFTWAVDGYPMEIGYDNYNTLFKIGGKIYCFDQTGAMITGWVHFDRAAITDPDSYWFMGSMNCTKLYDAYMYFDPKTGAAATGKKKVLTPALFNGQISLGEEEQYLSNNAKRVNTTSTQSTLNFDSNGVLIRDQQTKVGKKLTDVGADGTVTTGKDHWADANKDMYVLKNGTLATGRKKIDGVYYYFDPVTGYKVTNALRKSGNKWYYYNEFGKQETPVLDGSRDVILPEYMQLAWGEVVYVYFGSINGKDLTAVWNKDGSLAKIVYSGTNTPAAGESVSFGPWNFWDDDVSRSYIMAGLNGYVLDSKGLPMTGVVTGLHYIEDSSFDTYTLNVNKDGSKVFAGYDLSLVKIGKKYYVMHQGILYTRQDQIIQIYDWSALPKSERKSLDELAKSAYAIGSGLYVFVNADGSVVTNTTRYGTVYIGSSGMFNSTVSGMFTTNSQGIILDLCAPFFCVGKNCYVSAAAETDLTGKWETMFPLYKIMPDSDPTYVYTTVKGDGNKILGFYDAETGKALNGIYMIPYSKTYVMWMKNGKPQTGNQTYNYFGFKAKFYIHPNLAGIFPNYED